MSKCATTTATVAATATRKSGKGPTSKDLRARFVIAYDAVVNLGKVRTKANRAAKSYYDAVASGYSADATVLGAWNDTVREAAEIVAARIADVDELVGVRMNAEDSKAAGLATPPNGPRLAGILREAIGAKGNAKTTAEKIRG